VHEGGQGKAFLPNILETLELNPTAILTVPMARRNLQVKKSISGTYTAILLPEGLDTEEDHAIPATPSHSMMRLSTTGLGIFTFGAIVFAAGFLAFFSALLMVFLDPAGIIFGSPKTTPIQQMPMQQWETLKTSSSDQKYVKTLIFKDSKWTKELGVRTLVDESGQPLNAGEQQPAENPGTTAAPSPQQPGTPSPTMPQGQQRPGNSPSSPIMPQGQQRPGTPSPSMPPSQQPNMPGIPSPQVPAAGETPPPPAPPGTGMQLPIPGQTPSATPVGR